MTNVIFMELIKIIAEIFMSKFFTLINFPEVLVMMSLQHISDLAFNNKINMSSRESLSIYYVHCWMMLYFKKRIDPRKKVLMFVIVEVLLKKLDITELLQKHMMSQLNPLNVWQLDHNITVVFFIFFVVEVDVLLDLLV